MLRLFIMALTVLAAASCSDMDSSARVLVMGDSLMAVNKASGGNVAKALSAEIGEPVVDRSASGAGVLASRGIPAQFVDGAWDWVVLNGYGNDLLFGCGCGACADRMDRLVAEDGQSGAIPELVRRLRGDGARVIYTGYLRTPGFASPVERCVGLGEEMDRRLAAMARTDSGVTFLSLAGVVPDGDQSFHGPDRVHPSVKGSRAIADLLAELIQGR